MYRKVRAAKKPNIRDISQNLYSFFVPGVEVKKMLATSFFNKTTLNEKIMSAKLGPNRNNDHMNSKALMINLYFACNLHVIELLQSINLG